MKTNVLDFKSRTTDPEVELDSSYLMSVRKGRDSPCYFIYYAAQLQNFLKDSSLKIYK